MTAMTANPANGTANTALASGGLVERLWRYRELVAMLAWRDVSVRYRHSMLGAAWAILPPFAMMAVFSFVFGSVANVSGERLTGHATVPYSLFAFCGLAPWMLLANGLTAATGSLVSNRRLVTKIYFPREVLPLSSILSALVDYGVAMGCLGLLIAYHHARDNGWTFHLHPAILAMPIVLFVQLLFMSALALLLSMANLFYRDVGFLFRSLVQLWMFVTCVVYDLRADAPWKRFIIEANPMTPIIRAYRDCLLFGTWPTDRGFIVAAGASLVLLAVAVRCFRRREEDFAEHV